MAGLLKPKTVEKKIGHFFFLMVLVLYLGHGGIFHLVYCTWYNGSFAFFKNQFLGGGLELPNRGVVLRKKVGATVKVRTFFFL